MSVPGWGSVLVAGALVSACGSATGDATRTTTTSAAASIAARSSSPATSSSTSAPSTEPSHVPPPASTSSEPLAADLSVLTNAAIPSCCGLKATRLGSRLNAPRRNGALPLSVRGRPHEVKPRVSSTAAQELSGRATKRGA